MLLCAPAKRKKDDTLKSDFYSSRAFDKFEAKIKLIYHKIKSGFETPFIKIPSDIPLKQCE